MLIQYTYYWRWGDKSVIVYDIDKEGSRADLRRVINRIKNNEECTDIVNQEFEVITRKDISMTDILAQLDSMECKT